MKKFITLLILLFLTLLLLTACREVFSDDRPLADRAGQTQVTTTKTTQQDNRVCGVCAHLGSEGVCDHKVTGMTPASTCPSPEREELLPSRPKKTKKTEPSEPATTTAPPTTSRARTTVTQTAPAEVPTSLHQPATSAAATEQPAGLFNETYEQKVVALINAERANAGLAPLTMNHSLQDSARVRAKEITRVWGHKRPDGSRFATAIKISYCSAAENIAAGQATPERVVDAWMASPSHRDNILNPGYQWIGVGCYYDYSSQYKTYWSQLFVMP